MLLSMLSTLFATSVGAQNLFNVATHLDAFGQEVFPVAYSWGSYRNAGKGIAQLRHCGIVDGSGRLGKRQTCPGGYLLACDSGCRYPCCLERAPICMSSD